jgi:hypothetical protein
MTISVYKASVPIFRSVHHNVARLDAARAIDKSKDWPPNVVSIAEAWARRRAVRGAVKCVFRSEA